MFFANLLPPGMKRLADKVIASMQQEHLGVRLKVAELTRLPCLGLAGMQRKLGAHRTSSAPPCVCIPIAGTVALLVCVQDREGEHRLALETRAFACY